MMNRGALIVFLLINVVSLSVIGGYSLTRTRRVISSSGTVKAIDVLVFWDEDCTQPCDVVEWGLLEPGDVSTHIVYVLNDGNTPLTLMIYAQNWQPSEVEQYLIFTGTPDAEIVDPQGIVRVVLMLSVDPAIEDIESFSFGIVIEGIG